MVGNPEYQTLALIHLFVHMQSLAYDHPLKMNELESVKMMNVHRFPNKTFVIYCGRSIMEKYFSPSLVSYMVNITSPLFSFLSFNLCRWSSCYISTERRKQNQTVFVQKKLAVLCQPSLPLCSPLPLGLS